MTAASPGVQAAVNQFCAQLGLPPQPLPLALKLEQSGRLHLDEQDGMFCALLARPVPAYQRGVAAAALHAVHPDKGLPFPVRAAFRGDHTLVLLTRISSERVDLPSLDAMVRLLTGMARDAMAASG